MNVEISQPQVQYPLKLPLTWISPGSRFYSWMVSNYLSVTVHTDMFSEDMIARGTSTGDKLREQMKDKICVSRRP